MQLEHLASPVRRNECEICIEMRVEPHSKVVSRQECNIRPAGKTSTPWKELASAKSTSTTASTAELRPPVSSMRRGLHSLLSEALRQKRDADAYVRSAEPLSDEMLRKKNSPLKDPKKTRLGAFYDQKRVAKSPRSSTYRRATYPITRFKPAKRPSKGLQTVH